jgi:hypothetical protein
VEFGGLARVWGPRWEVDSQAALLGGHADEGGAQGWCTRVVAMPVVRLDGSMRSCWGPIFHFTKIKRTGLSALHNSLSSSTPLLHGEELRSPLASYAPWDVCGQREEGREERERERRRGREGITWLASFHQWGLLVRSSLRSAFRPG